MEIVTTDSGQTQELGRKTAASVRGGEVYALVGDLGAGKTTFTQGFADGLGIERIVSPTFIIMRRYKLANKIEGFLYHIDLYRLEANTYEELVNMGINDIWGNQNDVVLVEWADKLDKKYFPKNTVWINFEYTGNDSRKIIFK